MDRVAIGPVKGLRIAVAAFVLSVVLFVVVIGVALYLRNASINDTQHFATDLRNGLVASCERNGNPLREAVQKMLREQIHSSRRTPQSFFPDIPPEVFESLIRRQIKANRQTIRQIAPVDCASLYPPRP